MAIGRRLDPHVAEGYNSDNLTEFLELTLTNKLLLMTRDVFMKTSCFSHDRVRANFR